MHLAAVTDTMTDVLQIATGMYFTPGADVHATEHRATFYTNASVLVADPVDLSMGRLLFTTYARDVAAVTVEMTERIEDSPDFALVSTGGRELLDDFVAVLAFIWNVSFSRNELRLRQLVPTHPNPRFGAAATLAGTFDAGVYLTPPIIDDARDFLNRLLQLQRKHFEAAMRAIRRIVDATYLVEDDPTMAYTLYVAALESLAQLGSHIQPHDWQKYPAHKAKIVDAAISDLTDEQADKIRNAVLEIDQLALSRQFAAFTVGHIRDSYYRDEAVGAYFPTRAIDLDRALAKAYTIRSKNVHELRTLAPEIHVIAQRAEMIAVEGSRVFGLQGLNRLTRHVVRTFVDEAPVGVDTAFAWRDYLPGQARVRLAPELWIHQPTVLTVKTAAMVLDGFLTLLLPFASGAEDAEMVDMRPVLERAEHLLAGNIPSDARTALVAFYELWHQVWVDAGRPDSAKVLDEHRSALDAPSLYGFVVRVLLGLPIYWAAEEIVEIAEIRSKTLTRRSDQDLPPRLDAALMLTAAVFLWTGKRKQALEWVKRAVEFLPGDERLGDLERASHEVGLPDINLFQFVTQTGDWRVGSTDEGAPSTDAAAQAGADSDVMPEAAMPPQAESEGKFEPAPGEEPG